jgi:integrase
LPDRRISSARSKSIDIPARGELRGAVRRGPPRNRPPLVWPGTRIHPDTVAARFAVIEEKAGVPHRRLHSLRHSLATVARANGTPLDVIRQQLGHSSVNITQRYAHIGTSELEEAARRIGSVLGRGGE